MHPSPVGRIPHRLHHLGLGAETQLASENAKIHRTLQTRTGQLRRDSRTRHQPPFANTQGPPRGSSSNRALRRSPHCHSQCRSPREHGDRTYPSTEGTFSRRPPATSDTRPPITRTDESSTLVVAGWVHGRTPPRQRRTRWLVGPASERKALSAQPSSRPPWASTNPIRAIDEEGEHQPEGRDGENLPTNTGLKNTAACQSSGWCTPVLGLAALRVRHEYEYCDVCVKSIR